MKKLFSFGASILVTASFLDALYFSEIGKPIHWTRDALLAATGVACYVLLIRSWRKP
ncbi:MAG TPA: hypothetical protein VFG19_06840 [Geobacteraceae bacterium]|nr:hypothetical protein [Geobacteraceae bacterium]